MTRKKPLDVVYNMPLTSSRTAKSKSAILLGAWAGNQLSLRCLIQNTLVIGGMKG